LLKSKIEKYMNNHKVDGKIALYKEEVAFYIEKGIVSQEEIVEVKDEKRFSDLYLELANKETDELIVDEVEASFLNDQIHYLETNLDQYIYVESSAFQMISTESFILEVDSVFKSYELLLGLQLQKKFEKDIRSFIEDALEGDNIRYSLMFNGQEGLWEVNLPLENVKGFNKEMTVSEAIKLAYLFLFDLSKSLDN